MVLVRHRGRKERKSRRGRRKTRTITAPHRIKKKTRIPCPDVARIGREPGAVARDGEQRANERGGGVQFEAHGEGDERHGEGPGAALVGASFIWMGYTYNDEN